MGQPCPGLIQEPSRAGRGHGDGGSGLSREGNSTLQFQLLPKAVLETFWVPLQWAGIVAQNCSHFSDDYLPVLLRFQLLVSCIMYFISSLSSVHKFSIYFHPGLRYSFTCKVGKVLFFFPLIFWSLIPLKQSSSFFCHQKAVSGDEVHILLLQIFGDTFFPAASLLQSPLPAATLIPCCQ